MKRSIKKVAVLGSGIMGSRIACHFANVGVSVILLDIVPKEPTSDELRKGLTLESNSVRNRIVNDSLSNAVKSNPSPLYKKSFASRISTGNFQDNMSDISTCDWVIEVVVENLEIKKKVYDEVEKHRKPGTLITSNTSGIPIHLMAAGRSDDFRKNFCGTHFFNPPRYLRLLEVIPTPETDPELVSFLMEYGDLFLGKTTVLCKDTPAFIANRIGVFAIMSLLHQVEKMQLSVAEVDKLTGPVLGRPKSATFRTTDVVGLDTMIHVANGLYANCKDDADRDEFKLPAFVSKMSENKWLGDKTGQGFYKKVKSDSGKSEILELNLNTLEYQPQTKVRYATLEATKTIDNLKQRMPVLFGGTDKAGEFYRTAFSSLFKYVSDRMPEISDETYRIDAAMQAGFGWELGPFEAWDAIGVTNALKVMEATGKKPAAWVYKMLEKGNTSFYKNENGVRKFYDISSGTYLPIPGTDNFIILDNLRDSKVVWKNSGTTLFDIGDGVLNLEFHTKMNTIGGEVLEGINKAIDIAEKDFKGLVIGNDGANFSAGANLAMVFMFAVEQEYDEIDFAIRAFQNANMRVRYSSIPVVVAPHGLTLGGGCEMSMHADKVQAAAETYIGMVEFGVGLIPGGGGSKEFALRLSDSFREGDIELNLLKEKFLTIATAKVATSAHEAFDMGVFRMGIDEISINRSRLISDAKLAVLELANSGYTKPVQRTDIKVLGKAGLGMVYAGANSMYSGHYMSSHDKLISEKLGWVMCGGDLSAPSKVSEQYLLDLEREAFLSLCGEKKTLERIQSILTSGKPLRN
ncbi:MAG: enoyl-CoA hydratase/isomerase family protein [Bacteroidetes bacterium]|nr:enoyl-CoA hydratase/isomerase family protein [Bacteroidota bacterium]MBK9423204.1 enoyl-CoA hydratase/isomerase family protein [Bacteroidota bacterium]